MVHSVRLLTLSLAVLLLLIGCGTQQAGSEQVGSGGEKKALDFTLTDIKGSSMTLSSILNKKAALLDFTTTWCPHCVTIIPHVKNIYSEYNDKGLEVLAIYVNEPKNKVAAFAKKHNIPYKVLLDSDGSVASRYAVRGVPTIVVVAKDGTILYQGHNIPDDIVKGAVQ